MSGNGKKSGANIDRRRFLKSVAATGAMAAVTVANPAAAAASADEKQNAAK